MGTLALYLPSLSLQKQDKAIPSFLSEHLQQLDPEDAEGRDMLKRVAASLYGGGSDTVVSANSSFFLLMSLHPEVQRKAQEEIDRVVGHDRLPNAQDRKDLPYVEAIMREIARFNTVVPLCETQWARGSAWFTYLCSRYPPSPQGRRCLRRCAPFGSCYEIPRH